MSKKRQSCTRKIRHPDVATAKKVRRLFYKIGNELKLECKRVNVYRCHYCGKWHIGHPKVKYQARNI